MASCQHKSVLMKVSDGTYLAIKRPLPKVWQYYESILCESIFVSIAIILSHALTVVSVKPTDRQPTVMRQGYLLFEFLQFVINI